MVAPTRVEVVSDAGSPFQLALARMLAAVAMAAIMSGFVFVDLLDRGDPARLRRGRDKSGTF